MTNTIRMVQVSTEYIAASANRFNHAAHVSPDCTLVAFGSGRLVALWNVDASRPVLRLPCVN